ncbi:MAG: exostosin family protein [Stigonema ocellatum SAG 48.90 = DSM 106950]|nr:exostosin family protein [Stigonema ocellatum SAG 48.90 = DSM 106950]
MLTQAIDIWVNEALIIPGAHPSPLFLHMGSLETEPERLYWNILHNQLNQVVRIHKFKDLAEAGQLVLLPHELQTYFLRGETLSIIEFNRQVLASARTPITFTGYCEYMEQPGEIVFSPATFRSPTDTAIPTPGWMLDLSSRVSPIPKPPIPTVGFVGATRFSNKFGGVWRYLPIPDPLLYWLASSPAFNKMRLFNKIRKVIGEQLREKPLRVAEKSLLLKTSFIRREQCHYALSSEQKAQRQLEYIQNFQDNAYIICSRGAENYSFRLYETLSAGRIPVLIDTNMRLPDLGNMRWEEFSVIVPCSQMHRIGEIIQAFHNNLSDEEFARVCEKSRMAFEYLLPHNFIMRFLQQLGLN